MGACRAKGATRRGAAGGPERYGLINLVIAKRRLLELHPQREAKLEMAAWHISKRFFARMIPG